jgi:hypothetical protein
MLRQALMSKCRLVFGITHTRRSESMKMFAKTCAATIGLGLVLGLACAISGCDAGGSKAEYKPIDSPILKKLGSANQGQSDAAQAKLPARVKKKN